MHLTHAHPAVQKQRVVRFQGLFGHGSGSSMRKFVGLAYHERVEGVARVQLMIAALKIQLGLAGLCRRRRGCRLALLVLAANVLHLYVGRADLVEYRLNDVPIRPREDLPEDRAGDLYIQGLALGPVQPGRLEPSREGIDAHPGLHMLQELVPGACGFAFATNLGSCRHCLRQKEDPLLFPQMCKSCGKQPSSYCFFASGFLVTLAAISPSAPGVAFQDLSAYMLPLFETARDCLRLTCAGQAKSVRRSRKCCTRHAQVFHRRKSATIVHEPSIFQRIPRPTFLGRENLAQECYKRAEEIFPHFVLFLSGRSKRYRPKGSLPIINYSFWMRIVLASSRAPCEV